MVEKLAGNKVKVMYYMLFLIEKLTIIIRLI